MDGDWNPVLGDDASALYERLIRALERDIASGVLQPGTRLPPQRLLAGRLDLSLGTVMKAYVEAERRGLVAGHVGRGTFVQPGEHLDVEDLAGETIDLSVNTIPLGPATSALAQALGQPRRRSETRSLLEYAPAGGSEATRRACSRWLREVAALDVDWNSIQVTNGAQHALSLALQAHCASGSTVLCEELTYYGVRTAADLLGLRLHPVEIDHEGLRPDALDAAAAETGAACVYVMPTLQNPTTATMSAERRRQIIEVARRRGLSIIEDDNFAVFASPRPEALAAIAPDITTYVGGVAKTLAPGMRIGFLVAQDRGIQMRVSAALTATVFALPQMVAATFADWVDDGTASSIVAEVVAEVGKRSDLVRGLLAGIEVKGFGGPHLWLPMTELEAERTAGRALRSGVAVTPPEAVALPGSGASGLRLCIGAPTSLPALGRGIERVLAALGRDAPSRSVV